MPGPLDGRIGQILAKPVDIGAREIGKRDALRQGQHQEREIKIAARSHIDGAAGWRPVTEGLDQEIAGTQYDLRVFR
jgi:hypothetical protein